MIHPPMFSVFFRTLFIQAFWNYPRLLGAGFLYALLPAAKTLYPERERRIEFLQRHAGFFNSQPYCASLALGIILRREVDIAQSAREDAEGVQNLAELKEKLCGPLGLIGDQIFWQLLKPSAAALGMMGALVSLLLGGSPAWAAFLGAGILLLTFNPLHLWMRWWGLQTGFRSGANHAGVVTAGLLPALRKRVASIGFYLGLMLALVGLSYSWIELGQTAGASYCLCFLTLYVSLKRRLAVQIVLLIVALLGLLPVLARFK